MSHKRGIQASRTVQCVTETTGASGVFVCCVRHNWIKCAQKIAKSQRKERGTEWLVGKDNVAVLSVLCHP